MSPVSRALPPPQPPTPSAKVLAALRGADDPLSMVSLAARAELALAEARETVDELVAAGRVAVLRDRRPYRYRLRGAG